MAEKYAHKEIQNKTRKHFLFQFGRKATPIRSANLADIQKTAARIRTANLADKQKLSDCQGCERKPSLC
jgi:hypothetical protein